MKTFKTTRQPKAKKLLRGFSLLEMVFATALVAGTVVPALALIRDSMAQSRELNQRLLLSNYAVRIIEDRVAGTAIAWNLTPEAGDFAADGHPEIRYQITKSEDTGFNSSLAGQLMNLEATVYVDRNNDQTFNPGESQVTHSTKIANLPSYQNEEQ